jgi:sulfatase modifying factor 1
MTSRAALLVVLTLLMAASACASDPPKSGSPQAHDIPPAATPERTQDAATPDIPCARPMVEMDCRDGECTIPAGCFTMGVPRAEPFAGAQDDRQVRVDLTHAFAIGQTEVTREQWLAAGFPDPLPDWRFTGSDDATVPPVGYAGCELAQCPALWLTFEDAAAYANRRSERANLPPCYVLSDCEREPGRHMRCRSVRVDAPSPYACAGYRLPSEAEWEYAARAGTDTAFYSGEINPTRMSAAYACEYDANLDAIGWYCGNSGSMPSQGGGGRAQPVAQKLPNAFGLYDVSGNAYEWTNDLYDPRGYGSSARRDPVGGVEDPSDLTPARHPVWGDYADSEGYPGFRVCRGGSFDLWSFVAKSGRRNMLGSVGGQNNGFRLVRTL